MNQEIEDKLRVILDKLYDEAFVASHSDYQSEDVGDALKAIQELFNDADTKRLDFLQAQLNKGKTLYFDKASNLRGCLDLAIKAEPKS